MKKTVLIFGAGASRDNGIPIEHQMPLTKELFDEKLPKVQRALQLFPFIQKQLLFIEGAVTENGGIEEYLEKLQKEDSTLATHILWYLQELTISTEAINQQDNYSQFLHALWYLQQKELLHISDIINFNYDLFLDETVRPKLGLGLSQNPLEYIHRPQETGKTWRYIKPHGSANWYYKTNMKGGRFGTIRFGEEKRRAKINASPSIMNISRERDETGILIGDKAEIKDMLESGGADIPEPALIPPIIGKIIAEKFPQLAQAMEKAITQADHIILIGYGGNDKDFKDCLQKRADTQAPTIISAIGNSTKTNARVQSICEKHKKFTPGFIFTQGFGNATSKITKGTMELIDGIINIPNSP